MNNMKRAQILYNMARISWTLKKLQKLKCSTLKRPNTFRARFVFAWIEQCWQSVTRSEYQWHIWLDNGRGPCSETSYTWITITIVDLVCTMNDPSPLAIPCSVFIIHDLQSRTVIKFSALHIANTWSIWSIHDGYWLYKIYIGCPWSTWNFHTKHWESMTQKFVCPWTSLTIHVPYAWSLVLVTLHRPQAQYMFDIQNPWPMASIHTPSASTILHINVHAVQS